MGKITREELAKVLTDEMDLVNTQLEENISKNNSEWINIMYPPAPLTKAIGDGVADDTSAIQAVFNYFVTNQKLGVVFIPNGKFKITSKLIMDITYISLECTGEIDASSIINDIALQVKGGSELYSNIPYQEMHYIKGLFIYGAGKASGTTGILFESDTGSTTGISLWNCDIKSFGIGCQYRKNTYILNHFNISIGRCGVGVDMPSGYSNYGENIAFFGGVIANNDLGIRNSNANGNFHLTNVSVDYNGKQIEVNAGGVFLENCHLECNNTSNPITTIPYTVANVSSAKLTISGGVITFYNTPNVDYIFQTDNTLQAGGLILNGVTLSNALCNKELVGGVGLVYTNNLLFYDGGGNIGINQILSKIMNKLVDGSFEGTTIPDAVITSDTSSITSRTTGANIALTLDNTNYSDGIKCLKAVKTYGNGSNCSFILLVPVERLKQHAYRLKYKIPTTQTGTLYVTDEYINVSHFDQYGLPIQQKSVAKSTRTITLNGTPIDWTVLQTVGNLSKAPTWATHYVIRFNMFNMTNGTVLIDEIIATAM